MTVLRESVTLPNGAVLPNRFMKSALSEGMGASDRGPSKRIERLYNRWSTGGYGLVVTGNVMVDGRHLGEPGNIVVEDDRHLDRLKSWAKGFQDHGSPIWMQINHPGRQANALGGKRQPVAPSAIAARVPGMMKPRALSRNEIRDVIERFATTAAIAEAAGFDGVQIHGAHGYLVTQFLSPLTNQRTDEWGGDPARRRRFVIEVLRAIRAQTNPSFAVGIKLNSADFQRGGFTEEESRDVVRALVDEGIDLLEISGGSYEAPAMMGQVAASTAAREAYFLDYARSVRAITGDVPIAVTGGFRTAAAMERAVSEGDCDIIGLGRPTALVPDAPKGILTGVVTELPSANVKIGARSILGRVTDLKAMDGALDLSWHADQLHRMGDGKEPDPNRSWVDALVMLGVRNGPAAFKPRTRSIR
ncbi:NADH:flavin oxidoreductase/NADH oxidase family protein [Smaragdicoccus niigatensis]|uniref:NADH:flavin oxidoreductase/NADH oxidase family protein n=1 Tax=Smaragdicoccus niigatensis TaxID=359359 RepID=UPI00037966B0|nr:NADH:flavin oxidoreductase/NADH oxidase family protein [Smaragdicoccus niigatensis]